MNGEHAEHARNRYGQLAVMTALSFVAMFILMYAMVDRLANVYLNINQVYMAGLMAAPMALIELAVMRGMYENSKANIAISVVAVVALVSFFLAIRVQTAIGDDQFIRSMIPHHAGAILMCQQATITDAELKKLCGEIIEGQQREIDQMKAILRRSNG